MFDLLIKNGTVIDGAGSAGVRCDLAVQDGKIRAIGNIDADAARTIRADGLTVTPGFIDIHRHADAAVFRPDFGEAELRQGLTTIVNGNCGLSLAPFGPEHKKEILAYLRPIIGQVGHNVETAAMDGYLEQVGRQSLALNVGMLAGAGVIRADAAGFDTQRLEGRHFERIHNQLEDALAAGALGVSLGLGYAPECFYTTQELIRALAPLEGTGVPVTAHMRQEGDGMVESVREMIALARALDTPVHISHIKAIGKDNWQRLIPQALALIEQARQDGLALSCDVSPYTAGSTQLLHVLAPEFLQGGVDAALGRLADPGFRRELRQRLETGTDFENIARLVGWEGICLSTLTLPENKPLEGKSIAEIAALQGKDPLDCLCDLLIREHGAITMIDLIACEEDIASILQSRFSSLISDSLYLTEGRPHPRLYGSCVRLIEKYVCQEHILTLEQAVHKMTAAPADVLGLNEKGRLRVGADADINIFDPAKLHEHATYAEPDRFATGFEAVIVGGEIVLRQDKLTGECPGDVLLR